MHRFATGAGATVQEQDRQAAGVAAFLDIQGMQRVHREALGGIGLDIGKQNAHEYSDSVRKGASRPMIFRNRQRKRDWE
jgi:hypothetical protein